MEKEIIMPVVMFDEDQVNVDEMVKLFEKELTRITRCPITLDWQGLQLP
jgi:hypothetical protein